MKKLTSILLFTVAVLNLWGQDKIPTTKANANSFPTNIDEKIYDELKNFEGKIVAFDGVIEKTEISRNNTPFYKLKIGGKKYLWSVLMFKNESNKIGDTIRVVGYLRPNEPIGDEKKYLDGKYLVICFGLADFKNSNFLFLGGISQQKEEWINGNIPSSK